jgi:hypothetical protein
VSLELTQNDAYLSINNQFSRREFLERFYRNVCFGRRTYQRRYRPFNVFAGFVVADSAEFFKEKIETPRSIRVSLLQIVKIVSAFTLGHSLTLLLGAMAWVVLPSKWIEILIAFSILVSAIHAIRPIFAGKEMLIALGFDSFTDLLLPIL